MVGRAGHYVGTDSALVARPRSPGTTSGGTATLPPSDCSGCWRYVGLGALMRKGPELHNHLGESWIWSDDSWRLIPRAQVAQYHVYEVTPRTPPGG